MGANQLDNCRFCGILFLKDYTDYCIDCFKEIENDFNAINDFLKDSSNHDADIYEISRATNISVRQITDFIRNGRIYAEDFPNLGYPCQHCGQLIKRQMLCHNCFDSFSTEIERTLKYDGSPEMSGEPQLWKMRQGNKK
ncbi:MAG: flagellar protein [Planococcus sp. (in: firmicutes)]